MASGSFGRLAGRVRQHQDVVRFCLRFAIYSVVFFGLLFAVQEPVVEPFTRGIAWLTYRVMRAFGTPVSIDGTTVGVPGFTVSIRNNCNAIYEIGLYAAATLAYPASARQRTSGILFAGSVLYVVNLVRVVSLLYLGYLFPEVFEAAHVYVWQVLFLVVVAGLWLGWVSRIRPSA